MLHDFPYFLRPADVRRGDKHSVDQITTTLATMPLLPSAVESMKK